MLQRTYPSNSFRKHWPLYAALLVLWLTVGAVLLVSLKQNQGHLVYDVDDPYIHMAIAKNFVQHGLWGVTRYEFSSSSSSVLWPLLLALIYLIFGVNELAPLILNVVFAMLLLVTAYAALRQHRPVVHSILVLLLLLTIIVFTPLPVLIFTGMEHVLHTLVTIAFVYVAAQLLSRNERPGSSREFKWLLLIALLLSSVRYEGLFPILLVCGLLFLRKQWLQSFALGVVSLAPVGIYGAISAANGWFWLPNSVLLKGNLGTVASPRSLFDLLGNSLYQELLAAGHIQLLIIAALGLYILRFRNANAFWERVPLLLALFIGTALLHMEFAGRVRWFFRHDAYLVALGLFAIGFAFLDFVPHRIARPRLRPASLPMYIAVLVLAALLVLPIVKRGSGALVDRARSTLNVAQATTNIYEQQYQMALFLKTFYTGQSIAANDIGAINYFADIRCLDLDGLASLQVARLKHADQFHAEQIRQLTRASGTRIAIIYDYWLTGPKTDNRPSEWTRVGQWTISNNVSVGGDTISFYAIAPGEEMRLMQNLAQFASRLPPTVKQSGSYTGLLSANTP